MLTVHSTKTQIFRSIDRSCASLTNILENYQHSLFVFANEENSLATLLKECAKHDKTKAGTIMLMTGKSLSQSSHQRIKLYMPLMRLYQEMETFHSRAVEDASVTVDKLEAKRAQYRASLLWMKDLSEKLDPDVYRQLDKFRKVQNKVRDDKKVFDSLQMDVVQKIDLLMASRCNLMNQILAPYQSVLLDTFEKNYKIFNSLEESIRREDIYEYEFKELKQLNALRLDSDEATDTDEGAPSGESGQPKEEIDLLLDESMLAPKNDQNNNESNPPRISEKVRKVNEALVDLSLDDESVVNVDEEGEIEKGQDTLVLLEALFSDKEPPKRQTNIEPFESSTTSQPAPDLIDNKPQLTIDDLLSNELEDIDNSSYFKSLQDLKI